MFAVHSRSNLFARGTRRDPVKAALRNCARKRLWRLPLGQGQESGFPGHLYTSLAQRHITSESCCLPPEMMVQQWGLGC